MGENFDSNFGKKKETIERKKERLMPIFAKSLEIMLNPEMDLEEGILVVIRERAGGKMETISDLMVMEINEDGPNLAMIDEEGNPSASATMLWGEIIEAKPQK